MKAGRKELIGKFKEGKKRDEIYEKIIKKHAEMWCGLLAKENNAIFLKKIVSIRAEYDLPREVRSYVE